ncbi:CoA transferase subunit A [Leucobacter aridicollis]|uniref:CoA transferase subunit A n=1 Tax=Leucobacter aridicollis TaxID=283878 RepID=UPI00210628C2|nr:CoA-transferase [Leucobacter aridicollis]UTX54336.1 CoA transferase subunit A [Leucobacter aridicollis]
MTTIHTASSSTSKVVTLAEAIATHVKDRDTVSIEGMSHLIPFAAGHEIIRQGRRRLTLCRMTPDLVSDQLIAAGCVDKLVASFFASGSAGSLYEIRRRVEQHDPTPLEIEEYTHYGMVCRYHAGAARLPFMPLRSYTGSDMPRLTPAIKSVRDPYSGGTTYVVPPLNPDVTIVQAQRADRRGNVQMWGILGAQQEAVYAAKKAIVLVEEVVADEVIQADPNRTILPAHAVTAVVHAPGGAHPSYAQGYYDRDGRFYREWTAISQNPERLQAWLKEWVYEVADPAAYVAKLGAERWDELAVGENLSGRVNYGSRIEEQQR